MRLCPGDGLSLGRRRYGNSRPARRTVTFNGVPVKVEIEPGETRSGVDERGRPWSHEYRYAYGEIPSSRSPADGDGVDVYLGPDLSAPMVYVVHQVHSDGTYDEDKVMLGFPSEGEAVLAFKQHGASWAFGTMDILTWDQFRNGYLVSNRRI